MFRTRVSNLSSVGAKTDKKPLFLRWALINVLAVAFGVILSLLGFTHGVHGAPLVATISIVLVSAGMSLYGGTLAWRADEALPFAPVPAIRQSELKDIAHDADHIFHAIWLCQILGIVGALLGYRELAQASGSTTDPTAAIHNVFVGLGNGLTATLAGVLASLLFFVLHRLIDHPVQREIQKG